MAAQRKVASAGPVILLRAPFDDFDDEKARAAGANAILAMPFEPNDLVVMSQHVVL